MGTVLCLLEIRVKNVDTLELDPEVTEYLHAHGIDTIEQFIEHQDELSKKKIWLPVTRKVRFGC